MQVGFRGLATFQLINSYPITTVQVRMGTQVVGEISGTELRDVAGLYFSVPRTPGNYNITIYAKDSTGCEAVTTTPRSLSVF